MELKELLSCSAFSEVKIILRERSESNPESTTDTAYCSGSALDLYHSLNGREEKILGYTVECLYLLEQTLMCIVCDPKEKELDH